MDEKDQYVMHGDSSDPDLSDALSGIFRFLRDSSLDGLRGRGLELTTEGDGDMHRANADASSPHLYNGACGIAFFCAAYYSIAKDPEARKLALRLVHPLRVRLQRLVAADSGLSDGSLVIGGMIGLGSFLYTFGRMADWLKAPELMDAAQDVAMLITPMRIKADQRLDVLEGCAGTLLSLLSFIQEESLRGPASQLSLDLAQICGQHLLDCRVPHKSGLRAWPASGGLPICGFAYGTSGISYALAKLFEHTGQERFFDAAMEGFAFERSLYVPEQQAWLDPRDNSLITQGSWCSGAPGIALSRLGSIAAIDLPALRQDLEEALSITRGLTESRNDQLCCGNFGCIDVLHTAGLQLERLYLSDYARELSKRILKRAATSGFYFDREPDPSGKTRASYDPALFIGLAGVGYVLLRVSYPGLFPSVLLLQSQN